MCSFVVYNVVIILITPYKFRHFFNKCPAYLMLLYIFKLSINMFVYAVCIYPLP